MERPQLSAKEPGTIFSVKLNNYGFREPCDWAMRVFNALKRLIQGYEEVRLTTSIFKLGI